MAKKITEVDSVELLQDGDSAFINQGDALKQIPIEKLKGLNGTDGEDGVGIKSIEQTTSEEDGGENVITITLTDDTSSQFTVKNGSKGSTGPQGPQGEQGIQGEPGADGQPGEKGADGKSAYAYAQDAGYTGTEEAFAQKLAAETGSGGVSDYFALENRPPAKGGAGEGSLVLNSEDLNSASGPYATATGLETTAPGAYAFAGGRETRAIGWAGHTEGTDTTAGMLIVEDGEYVLDEETGLPMTTANDHAEGSGTQAIGGNSHAEGEGTIAASRNQHVQGMMNIPDYDGIYAHIVGNGSYDGESNAHTLDWEGNAWFAGSVTIGELKEALATVSAVADALTEAKTYADDKDALLLNNSSAAVDSIMELASLMEENDTVVSALEAAIGNKTDKGHGHAISDVSGLQSALDGKAASSHTHNYAAASHGHAISDITNLQSTLNGKANSSHGNHVPTTESANNARFLRNDNTWQKITPDNIGAAASSHTHNYAAASHTHSYLPLSGGTVDGSLTVNGNLEVKVGLELLSGYLDFHYNKSTADYTTRVIEVGAGILDIGGGKWGNIRFDSANGFVHPSADGNFSLGTSGARFYECYLKNSPNVSSLAELKSGITHFTSALEEVEKTDVFTYKYNEVIEREGEDIPHVGFVIGDDYNCSDLLIGKTNDGIDLYNAIGVTFGAVKELYELVKQQQAEIEELKGTVA